MIKNEAKISDLSLGNRNIDISGQITEKKEVRTVNTRYGQKKVVNVTLQDESGEITLVLWEDNIEKISEGDKVKIEKGYISEWNGKLQLNVSRGGKIETIS